MSVISLTKIQAMVQGYRYAYYSDCPTVFFKIKNLTIDDFDMEEFGFLIIKETDIHLTP